MSPSSTLLATASIVGAGAAEGAGEDLRMEVPKGHYLLVFHPAGGTSALPGSQLETHPVTPDPVTPDKEVRYTAPFPTPAKTPATNSHKTSPFRRATA